MQNLLAGSDQLYTLKSFIYVLVHSSIHYYFFTSGLLEVHPLAFICLITSEGSHVEKLSSATVKTQGLKTVPIGLHPSFLSQAAPVFSQDGTSTPLSMNDNFPAYVSTMF